ncbi:MAG TPA: transcription elongation factor GreAB, partial [Kiritimatiellia bacterium]|nr:transcription elongation factor GreAB [Kiritimatiellia bacterium]HMP00201.1 transcription elongation factor GreAB [Kiritimatiellia bacterium]HMP96731.1 transcription elongation factor GreAB [Kiritimatiellia bacterium]
MNKTHIVDAIIAQLKIKAGHHFTAAKSAHAEATHEESIAEDKYDTRGLEAGYLAVGQARMMEEAAEAIRAYANLFIKKIGPGEPIDLTAVVDLSVNKRQESVFIGPSGGGVEVSVDGKTYTVITPESPLGQLLMGKNAGDRFKRKVGPFEDSYRITAVS